MSKLFKSKNGEFKVSILPPEVAMDRLEAFRNSGLYGCLVTFFKRYQQAVEFHWYSYRDLIATRDESADIYEQAIPVTERVVCICISKSTDPTSADYGQSITFVGDFKPVNPDASTGVASSADPGPTIQ